MQWINILRHGWRLVFRNWRATGGYALFAWICAAVVLMPLSTFLFHHLAVNEDVIISNYSIHLWLATPQGIACLLLVGSVSFFTYILYLAGLFDISAATLVGNTHGVIDAIQHVFARLPRLLHLSFLAFILFVLAVVVLATGPGLLYLAFLTEHDINFYLSHQPPQWWASIFFGGLWIVIWGIIFIRMLLRLSYVVPIWRQEGGTIRRAAQMSRKRTLGVERPILGMMLTIQLLWFLITFLSHSVFFALAGIALGRLTESITGTIAVVVAHGLITVLVDVFVTLVCASWAICVLLISYRHNRDDSAALLHQCIRNSERKSLSLAFKVKVVFGALVLLALVSWGSSVWLLGQDSSTESPLVIAHRAGAADAPENSLTAMEKTISHGAADIVEIDVTPTKDGKLVILHDKDLMRLAGDGRIVRETNYDDLKDIDIGSSFGEEFEGERIALLDDFLALAQNGTRLILEFKHGKDTNLIERTISAVREYGLEYNVVIMSLELDEVRKIQELAPDIKVGYFASLKGGDVAQLNVDVIGAKSGMATAEFIKDAHENGTDIYAWTIDEPERMLELIEAGVDGIITNDPQLARKIVERVKALPPSARTLLKFRRFWVMFKKLGWWDV